MAIRKTTTSSPYVDMDVTTLAAEFQNANSSFEGSFTVDVATSPRVSRSPSVTVITCVSLFGIVGLLMNIVVLVVLFQKINRKHATNRYLINLAISESTNVFM